MKTFCLLALWGVFTGCAWLRPPEPTGYGGHGPYDRSAYETDEKQQANGFGAPEPPRNFSFPRAGR